MKKILIIEDEAIIAMVYKNKFTRAGFSVEVAHDGQAGLDLLTEWQPDLVLLDLMLPKINGLELLRLIRAKPTSNALPVIVYSNAFTAGITEEARKLGVAHMFSKSDTRPNQVIEKASALLQVSPETPLPVITPIAMNSTADAAAKSERDRETYLAKARQTVAEMRQLLANCLKSNDSDMLADLRLKTRVLGSMAWMADVHRVARLAEGLEAFLRTLCKNPQYISFSTDKSVLQTVDCLVELMEHVDESRAPIGSPSVLVVDDQEISLHAAKAAIQNARLNFVGISDVREALQALEANQYDLVLLDINMPKMDGITLCGRLRQMPHHRETPVVFFSQLSDYEYRAGSMAAGGNDFIGKPYLTIELAVKALTWVVKPRLATV